MQDLTMIVTILVVLSLPGWIAWALHLPKENKRSGVIEIKVNPKGRSR